MNTKAADLYRHDGRQPGAIDNFVSDLCCIHKVRLGEAALLSKLIRQYSCGPVGLKRHLDKTYQIHTGKEQKHNHWNKQRGLDHDIPVDPAPDVQCISAHS